MFERLDSEHRQFDSDNGDKWQINMEINRLVMIECDLTALAFRTVWRCFCFAVAVGRAAASCATEHKILFAGDATAPEKCYQQQQGQQRTGKSAVHGYFTVPIEIGIDKPAIG